MRSKAERMAIFFDRLLSAAPCGSQAEAFALVGDLSNAVEDEFTAIPFAPSAFETAGRLYPPQADSRRTTGHPGIVRYRSRRHSLFFAENGAISIVEGTGTCLDKPGADGRTIGALLAERPSKR